MQIDIAQELTSVPDRAYEQNRPMSTYASFGDEGVTASANSYGHLLQITRYFGNEASGFFCVDLPNVSPPYYITQRMQDLQHHFVDPDAGMRISFEGSEDADAYIWTVKDEIPVLKFVHDRWPCFITQTSKFDLSIQYLISNKIVYQTYKFKLRQSLGPPSEIPTLAINANLLLRDLNFATDGFNTARNREGNNVQNLNGEDYAHCLSFDEYSIIRTHKVSQTEENTKDAVALYIAPFINNRPQRLQHVEGTEGYQIIPDNKVLRDMRENNELTIMLAYRLELISLKELENLASPVSPTVFSEAQDVVEAPFEILSFTEDEHLNFTMRRNLEHILSVCSIPIGGDTDEQAIALTCGDISGHRVSAAASFYAFHFLILALRHFQDHLENCAEQSRNASGEDSYVSRMLSRIRGTCRGHLNWICKKLERRQGLFSLNCWASGKVIDNQQDNVNLRKQSLVNTPFQIIKAAEFCQVASLDEDTKVEIANDFRDIVKDWVKILDERNRGGHFTYPNQREETTQWVFHISDHAIIWRALKGAEMLGLDRELCVNQSLGRIINRQEICYSSESAQSNILKRFTTEIFGKLMIATSRSSSESRVLFLPKDTVLFYAMDLGLFDENNSTTDSSNLWQNKIEAWKNTVDYQKEFGDNLDADWDQPLWFSLALIMSASNKSISSRPATEMRQYAKTALIQSSSSSGLFSGLFDENKEFALFESEAARDPYWSATFEVPYILWKYERLLPQSSDSRSGYTTDEISSQYTSTSTQTRPTAATSTELVQELKSVLEYGKPLKSSSETLTYHKNLFKKHGVLFSNAIDQRHIMEISDEWLYNEPRFFTFHANLSNSTVKKFRKDYYKKMASGYTDGTKGKHDETFSETNSRELLSRTKNKVKAEKKITKKEAFTNDIDMCYGKVIHEAVTELHDPHQNETGSDDPHQHQLMGRVIDVPRIRHYKKEREFQLNEVSSSNLLLECLRKKRTPAVAKKRIFHFWRASREIALICYLSSSEAEEISFFFDRHALSSPYFFESTTGTLNKWVTELHLSFYQILPYKKSFDFVDSIHKLERSQFPHYDLKLKGDAKSLSRAMFSFRFDGDLLDRYWTCHLVEHNPQQMVGSKEMTFDITTQPVHGALKPNPWRQRRVLELLLFDRILREMLRCTGEILEEAKGALRDPKRADPSNHGPGTFGLESELPDIQGRFTEIGGDVFLSHDWLWYRIQQVLQAVEEDLGENLAKIKLWIHREDDRGPDKPRWTLKDEYRYRGAISKLRASNDFHIEELMRCRAKITAFISQLTRKTEATQSNWQMQSTNDVRLFTYVTVIFLPTSFATGVFSMSDTPSKHMMLRMGVTAIVAIFITLLALIHVKALATIIKPLLKAYRQLLKLASQGSSLAGQRYIDVVNQIRSADKINLTVSAMILECAFIVISSILYYAHKYYLPEGRSKTAFQSVHFRSIYVIARYIFYPLREKVLSVMPDAEVDEPEADELKRRKEWKLHETGDPIKQAFDAFNGVYSNVGKTKSDFKSRKYRKLFDNIGRRNIVNFVRELSKEK